MAKSEQTETKLWKARISAGSGDGSLEGHYALHFQWSFANQVKCLVVIQVPNIISGEGC